jgi:hypothetical protein
MNRVYKLRILSYSSLLKLITDKRGCFIKPISCNESQALICFKEIGFVKLSRGSNVTDTHRESLVVLS